MKSQALLIFREDFVKRSFFDWVIAHVSGSLPPHRYAGNIEISGNCIRFCGIDTRVNREIEFLFLKERIREIYYGYDETYNIFQTRGLGLTWAPVRVKFDDAGDQEKIVYFITGIDRFGTTNKDFYNYITAWLS